MATDVGRSLGSRPCHRPIPTPAKDLRFVLSNMGCNLVCAKGLGRQSTDPSRHAHRDPRRDSRRDSRVTMAPRYGIGSRAKTWWR